MRKVRTDIILILKITEKSETSAMDINCVIVYNGIGTIFILFFQKTLYRSNLTLQKFLLIFYSIPEK